MSTERYGGSERPGPREMLSLFSLDCVSSVIRNIYILKGLWPHAESVL